MQGPNLLVSSCVVILEGCPVAINVDNTNQVQVTCGTVGEDAFEFVLQREVLRAIVEQGASALAEIEELRSRCVG
jgi:hypothetical protein